VNEWLGTHGLESENGDLNREANPHNIHHYRQMPSIRGNSLRYLQHKAIYKILFSKFTFLCQKMLVHTKVSCTEHGWELHKATTMIHGPPRKISDFIYLTITGKKKRNPSSSFKI